MVNATALITNNKGNNDFIKGEAVKLALEIPKIDAIGLTQTAVQAPLLQTAKNNGMDALTLPVSVVQIDFILFIFKFNYINNILNSVHKNFLLSSTRLF